MSVAVSRAHYSRLKLLSDASVCSGVNARLRGSREAKVREKDYTGDHNTYERFHVSVREALDRRPSLFEWSGQ